MNEAKTELPGNVDLQTKYSSSSLHKPTNHQPSLSTESAEVVYCNRTSLFNGSSGSILKTIDDANSSLQSIDTGSKIWSTPRQNGQVHNYQFDHDADTVDTPVIVNHNHNHDVDDEFDHHEIQSNNDSVHSNDPIATHLDASTPLTPVATDTTVEVEDAAAEHTDIAQNKARSSLEFHSHSEQSAHSHSSHSSSHSSPQPHGDNNEIQTMNTQKHTQKHNQLDPADTAAVSGEYEQYQTMDAVLRRNSSDKTCVLHDDENDMSSSSHPSQATCRIRNDDEDEDEADGLDDPYGHERVAVAAELEQDEEYDSFDDEKLNHIAVAAAVSAARGRVVPPPQIESSSSVMLEMIGSPNISTPSIVPNVQQSQQDLDERFFFELHSQKQSQDQDAPLVSKQKSTLSYQKLQRFGHRANTIATRAAGKSLSSSRDRTQSQPFAVAVAAAAQNDSRWWHAAKGTDASLMTTVPVPFANLRSRSSEYSGKSVELAPPIESAAAEIERDINSDDEPKMVQHRDKLQKMKYRLIVGAVCCVTLLIGYVVYTKNSKVVIHGYRGDAPMIPSRRARALPFHR